MPNELTTVKTSPILVLEGDPEAQLEYAAKAAKALMKRVEGKKRKVIVGGKQYLEYGDWQTVARFFGATAGTEWCRLIEKDGELKGYEARAVVHQHGVIIAAADAICLRSEKNWRSRDWYAIYSMAQTRACAKALRNAFGWVAELAGYSDTPAEELDSDHTNSSATDQGAEVEGGGGKTSAPNDASPPHGQSHSVAESIPPAADQSSRKAR